MKILKTFAFKNLVRVGGGLGLGFVEIFRFETFVILIEFRSFL